MKTITKLLALSTLLALTAACNTLGPTSPSDIATSDEVVATVDSGKGIAPSPCKGVADVQLTIAPSPRGSLLVRATYVSIGAATSCPGPSWTSDPKGILMPSKDSFLVGVGPFDTESVTVTATAPNGVVGSITIKGPRATTSKASQCNRIAAVDLQIVQGAEEDTIYIKASYVLLGGSQTFCPAPTWTSSPRGALVPAKDPFQVGVSRSDGSAAIVTATAPNGVIGEIKVAR